MNSIWHIWFLVSNFISLVNLVFLNPFLIPIPQEEHTSPGIFNSTSGSKLAWSPERVVVKTHPARKQATIIIIVFRMI